MSVASTTAERLVQRDIARHDGPRQRLDLRKHFLERRQARDALGGFGRRIHAPSLAEQNRAR